MEMEFGWRLWSLWDSAMDLQAIGEDWREINITLRALAYGSTSYNISLAFGILCFIYAHSLKMAAANVEQFAC